ncbi:MAG: glycosyltransferase family 2 protein [Nitrospirae bacterium]|nr:glycosyltransferase family 2 protein [Nitrospirota bacterium]MBF0535789.1 glycosyltransferase family 2 protein [Nitrospirota bacterium]MBF0617670.1 glycosyltransferase family 2 protein [Nitrospirota bacterium]
MNKVVVFIPAYNEEETIAFAIDKVCELYPESVTAEKNYFVEILVVNDGSVDKTEEIAESKGVRVVSHPTNMGLGAATRIAMMTAYEMGADVAVKLDADLQHDPADIEKVVMPILFGKADICWGSRFAGKIHYKMPIIRRLGNMFFTWLMNQLTPYGISDAQTGLMAYGKRYLAVFELFGSYNPPQQLLIDASNKFMKYAEVPVVFYERKTGRSFVSLRYPFYVFINILRIMIYGSPLKLFTAIGSVMVIFSIIYFIASTIFEKYLMNFPILLVNNLSLATLIVGLQCFFFGILADLLIKRRR